MKWRILASLVVGIGMLQASPVGNAETPGLLKRGFFMPRDSWLSIRVGYEGDFVIDERMKQQTEGSGRVDNYEQFTNAGTFTFDFVNRLDIYGVFGSSRVNSDWRFMTGGTNQRAQLETKYDFLWGVGARAILAQWMDAALGLAGRYSRSHMDPVWLTINGASQSVGNSRLNWRAWNVALDASIKVELFIPYVGVQYFNATTKLDGVPVAISNAGSGNLHMKNRSPVGIFVGCSLTKSEYFFLNIEGRFINEEALSISGDLCF